MKRIGAASKEKIINTTALDCSMMFPSSHVINIIITLAKSAKNKKSLLTFYYYILFLYYPSFLPSTVFFLSLCIHTEKFLSNALVFIFSQFPLQMLLFAIAENV